MGTLGAIISSISSLAAKLVPESYSSSRSDESPVIEDLNKLLRTLERIRVTLVDAEERAIRDKAVKHWLKELKQVAYAAEDVLDEYQYEVLRAQVESRGDSAESKKKKLELPDDLADRIKQTISLFDEIARDRIALQLRDEDGLRHYNNETYITPTSHMVVESNIFGREDEKEKLINLLCSDNNNNNNYDDVVSVVTIVGMGGLGKTTVAQLVYKDRRIRKKFGLLGWVCVSEDFNVERLTKEVVESITRSSCNVKNLSVLQKKLKDKITKKMVFLVLDDVWNENINVWELFLAPFLSAKSVKILVTTRNESVACIMQTIPSFKLGYLSDKQCWLLFRKYAFGGENCNEGWKLKMGKQIIKKCGMLPLAVKAIASLLRHEANIESWREILDSELWELEAAKDIYPPLQISYLRLPTYLKPCLIHCSMYPKEYNYRVEELTELWYAHGYIELKGTKTIEEIGQVYVKQLFDRSFFEGNSNILSKGFKLHNMIHDFARLTSRNECYSIEYGKLQNFSKQIFHLYVESVGLVKLFPSSPFTSLRTLITGSKVEKFAFIFDILETRALRVIVFKSHCFGFGFCNSIGNLKHLRYISLTKFTFEMLPESICSLYNLKILSLYECHNLIELPNGIGNLVSLEFISLDACSISRLPESICHLRKLKGLYINSRGLVELPERIGNIISLEIVQVNKSRITVLPASLCQLKSLRILQITSYEIIKELHCEIGNLTILQSLKVSKVSSPPLRLNKLTRIQKLNLEFDITVGNNSNGLGCDLERTLIITSDTPNILTYSKHELSWVLDVDIKFYEEEEEGEEEEGPSKIIIKIKNEERMDLLFLVRFQLKINFYPGITFPKWTGDLFACASLESVCLEECENLVFLPFNNLQNLKYLRISGCHSLLLIQTGFVSSRLQELIIWSCCGLICVPGVQNLKSLVKLEIGDCPSLKSLLKESEPFHRVLLMGLTNLTSLQSLEIDYCPRLRVMADELRPVESCTVRIHACPNLREWCLQHNFDYSKGIYDAWDWDS